jgi:nitrogen-specific signal transduction histidine kinase
LKLVPALEVLEWIDAPVLALSNDGTIPFANWAFADMIGLTPEW